MKHPLKLQAFTMIEMLVVLAIIAILVGITFPVIMKAKMKGQIVKSATNLKNIGVACRLYTSDNEGFFPSSDASSARADYNLLIPTYASRGIFQAPTDATALQIAKTNTLTTLASNENSYTYFSGLDVVALSSSVGSSTDSIIPLATERLNQKPLINTNSQTLTAAIFKGSGVNVLKSDGAVTFVPLAGTGVRLYKDTNLVSAITNMDVNAGWKNYE